MTNLDKQEARQLTEHFVTLKSMAMLEDYQAKVQKNSIVNEERQEK